MVLLPFKNKTHRTQVLCQPTFHLELNFNQFKYQVALHTLNLDTKKASLSIRSVDLIVFFKLWSYTKKVQLNMCSPFLFRVCRINSLCMHFGQKNLWEPWQPDFFFFGMSFLLFLRYSEMCHILDEFLKTVHHIC